MTQAELSQRISDYQNEMLNFFFMYDEKDEYQMDMEEPASLQEGF